MPELPEVETVRRGLQNFVRGFRIEEVHELHPRVRKGTSLTPIQALAGARIEEIHRRGKFLWFQLDRPEVLVAHLGMSGQFLIERKDRPTARHPRARFALTRRLRRRALIFNDQRTFGWLAVEHLRGGIPTSVQDIAPDPFDEGFDRKSTIAVYSQRNLKIKTALLNQSIMSGVGNIYADESLWRAKVHPEVLTSSMTKVKLGRVVDSAIEVMAEAIGHGGTSFDDMYINVNGESGFFEPSLAAYGRTGQPCPRCGTPIARLIVGARSSHFCPRCQR